MPREPREPRVDAKLKRAHPDLQRELWELRNPPDPDQKPLSFDALQVEVPRIFGFTASAGALSDWLAWYGLKDRLEKAAERKIQTQLELAKNPNLSPHSIAQASQAVFMAEALVDKDLKGYAILQSIEDGKEKNQIARERLELGKERLALDRDKLTAASRSKIDAGLDALMAEIQASPRALEIFKQLKEEVAKQ